MLSPRLIELHMTVQVLDRLLKDPQPGLFTWSEATTNAWKRIADMWLNGEDAKTKDVTK